METDSKIAFTDPRKKVNLKMPNDKIVSENPRKMKPRRRMSNDPQQSVKVFCAVCDQVYQMSGLRKHVAHKHGLTLTRYREMYGDLRKQIIQLVHHACVLCKQVLLLDTEDISKHVSKKHKMGYTSYARRFMERGSGLISAPATSVRSASTAPAPAPVSPPVTKQPLKTKSSSKSRQSSASTISATTKLSPKHTSKLSKSSPKSPRTETSSRPMTRSSSRLSSSLASPVSRPVTPVLPPTPPTTPPIFIKSVESINSMVTPIKNESLDTSIEIVEPAANTSLVIIQCDVCFKQFSKNIQLKVHKRKNH